VGGTHLYAIGKAGNIVWAASFDWHSSLGLAQKADDLLFGVFAGTHVHRSPMRWISWQNGWYSLSGAGQRNCRKCAAYMPIM